MHVDYQHVDSDNKKKEVCFSRYKSNHTLILISQFSRPIVVTLGPRGKAYEPS
jgi:hypothetical protein